MDQRTAGKCAGALQTVFQFANVARPVIGQHDFDGLVGKNFFLARSTRTAFHKMSQKQRNILAPLSQRWYAQTENVQPEIQIAAESTFHHRLLQNPVRGGQDADVDGNTAGAADGANFLFLDSAQKLGLQVNRKFADFVEEYGSTFGDGQQSILGLVGARERSLDVTEQLAFDQR